MTEPSTAGHETEYTVFISSPSDVDAERERVKAVLNELNAEFAGRFRSKAVSWPDAYYTASATFQRQIPAPSGCHLVVCVLWSRLGSLLPAEYNRADGSPRTGTEWEFEDALQAALASDGGLPDILVYRKTKEDLTVKAGQIDDQQSQLRALDAFWLRWFRDEQGHFTAGFDSFETIEEFSEKLKRHLRLWIEARIKRSSWSIDLQGSPYRGLESFDADHAEVFFGRRRAIRQVIARLQTKALDGCAFLVVVGMSGVGKSSMVKAGVLPWLVKGRVASDVDEWRSCVIRCDALLEDPALALAQALFAPDCAPELAAGDYRSPQALAALMREAPSAAAAPITAALRRAGEALQAKLKLERPAKVQLAVVFDQLETLLLGPPAAQAEASGLMDMLARSGGAISVIATLRSDYYPQFQANPLLTALKNDGASYDLAPPTPLEINDIIEGPARGAGLGLQQDGEQDLATLLNKAAATPGSLPLLEFTLAALFEGRDKATDMLLLKTYADLGGLEGAIAVEAERLVAGLSPALQAALPALLLGLVDLDERRGAASASIRTLPRASLVGAEQAELADRLIGARFLVADHGGGGATIRLAHDALLEHWPRLAALIAAEASFLGARRRLEHAAQVWSLKDRHPDFLLPHGRQLAEATALLATRSDQLDALTREFIGASDVAATARQSLERARSRRRLVVQSSAAAVALVLAVVGALVIGRQQHDERVAEANEKVDQLIAAGRYSEAIPLAVAALPASIGPAATVAEQGLVAKLQYALERDRLDLAISGFDHRANHVAFDRAGDRILAQSSGGEVGVWDASTGAPLLPYADRKVGCCAVFDATGARVVAASDDPRTPLEAIDVAGGAVHAIAGANLQTITLAVDGSGQVLVAGGSDGALRIWNAATLAPLAAIATGGGPVNAVAFCAKERWLEVFSRDGKARQYGFDGAAGPVTPVAAASLYKGVVSADCTRLAAGSNRMLWSWSPNGAPLAIKSDQNVDSLAISPAGDRIAASSDDGEAANLWNAATGERVATLPSAARVQSVAFDPADGRVAFAGFGDWVELRDGETGAALPGNLVLRDDAAFNRQIVFSSDGTRAATVADTQSRADRGVRIWDVRSRPAVDSRTGLGVIQVGAPVRRVAFSPDRQWMATASADGLVRFWSAATLAPEPALDFIHHDGSVLDVAFDPSAPRVATASVDGTAAMWSLTQHKALFQLPAPPPVDGRSMWAIYVAFDPKAPEVVSAFTDTVSNSGVALLADDQLDRPLSPALSQGGADIWSAAFDQSGRLIVTASENKTAAVWDARTHQLLHTLAGGHTAAVNWAGFDHRGDEVVTVSDDSTARLWDVASGGPLGQPLQNDPAGMTLMGAFSPDDTRLVTSTSTGRLYTWDVATHRLLGIRMLGSEDENLFGVAFDPDGRRIAVAAHDGTVQVIPANDDPQATLTAARALVKRVYPKPS